METSKTTSAVKSLGSILFGLTLIGTSPLVLGQSKNPQTTTTTRLGHSSTAPTTAASTSDTRTSADETFELNIVERRYSQEQFEAATQVGTNTDPRKLNLQVGVSLASGRIDLLLRNVHGTVRFRGSLGRVLEIIGERTSRPAADSPPPASPAVP